MDMFSITEPNLVFDRDDDDDVYYAELRKQILVLTADDDEDEDFQETGPGKASKLLRRSCLTGGLVTAIRAGNYLSLWEDETSDSVPAWLLNLWRNTGNGTGVFIPHIVQTRRYRKGRVRRTYKQKGYN